MMIWQAPGGATVSPYDGWKAFAEILKNWTEAFAWACAGGFFVYKAISGYLISNLTLSISCRRKRSKPASGASDYLVVSANVKKGERGAVSLHDLSAHVSPTVPGEADSKQLAGIRRLTSRETAGGIFQIGKGQATKVPLLNLPPGEETTFSQYFRVPAGELCTVEVTVLGGWQWHGRTRYQWRASTISLPVEGDEQSEESS